jgi:putative ABC transport system permease protein
VNENDPISPVPIFVLLNPHSRLVAMISDLRLAVRVLGKSPGFSLVVFLTLALGIGANTAIFSFFNGILLRPLPYADAEKIVLVKRGARNFADIMGEGVGLQTADYLDFQAARTRSFSAFTTYNSDVATLTGRGSPDLVFGATVPANFFTVLGSQAAFGRTFSSHDTTAQSGRMVVLSYAFWQTRFGGDPALIGQSITLNAIRFTVVGVTAPDFDFPHNAKYWATASGAAPEGTIGVPNINVNGRGDFLRTVIGRLAPGVNIAQAEKEFSAMVRRLPNPAHANRDFFYLVNLRDMSVGNIRQALSVLLAGVIAVLFIACLNIGNLMLSRATTRQRELSIRLALGAARWQIARQLLAESLVLAFFGGVAGIVLSWWGVEFLLKIAPEDIPRLAAVHVDTGVLGFAVGISLLTGLVCGLAPIVSTAHTDLTSAIKTGGDRGGSAHALPSRLRAILVSGEVALSLVLLVAAGLLLRSFQEMVATSWGFEPRKVAVLRVAFAGVQWNEPAKARVFYRRLMAGLETQPGFESVAVSFDKIGESWIHAPFTPQGYAFAKPEDVPTASYHFVSPGYFRTLGIALVQGRAFTSDDAENAPSVAIIDAATAQKYFPDGHAVGRRIQIEASGSQMAEVVGVTGDVKSDGPEAPAQAALYLPYLQQPVSQVYVSVRTTLDVATAGRMIQQVVNTIDSSSPTTDLGSMEEAIARPAANRRFPLVLIGVFAWLALLLAGIGIYGVTAYAVGQRKRELGVRLALGAPPAGLVALMLKQNGRPVVIGLLLGFVASVITAYAMRGLLYRTAPLDAVTFLFVPLILGAVSFLACFLPARRATKVDPMVALRAE